MTRHVAFVFPGQGAQYVGMGASFVERFTEARAVFEEADRALGFSIGDVCFKGPEENLRQTQMAQPAILTVSCALLRLIQARTDMVPTFVAGHSLGEYSALVAAGTLEFGDAVKIVHERGRLMEEAVPAGAGGMAAIMGLTPEVIESLCKTVRSTHGIVEPATLNGPGQIVVAGEIGAIKQFLILAEEAGARRAVSLSVSGPFHSSLLSDAGAKLGDVLMQASWSQPSVPVIANVTAGPLTDTAQIRQALVEQVSSAVRWEESVRYMLSEGITTFIEIGPGKVLSGLIRRIDRSADVMHVDDIESLDKVLAWAKGDGII